MANARFLSLDEAGFEAERHGQKATLLARAVELGECVPPGFALDTAQAMALARGDGALEAMLESSLAWVAAQAPEQRLAVRASPRLSLPGALVTVVDVEPQPAAVLDALRAVLASTRAVSAVDQLRARGHADPTAPWTGVLVQRFVKAGSAVDFGAVVCTRNPSTGEASVVGEYMPGGGVSLVVSGRAQPLPLASAQARREVEPQSLERTRPEVFAALKELAARLEAAFDEPLELELAHVAGVTWLVQVRPLVLSPRGLARVALDAIATDSPNYRRALHQVVEQGLSGLVETRLPSLDQQDPSRVLARGLSASPGVARGVLMIDLEAALERSRVEPVVLARRDAVPEDVAAFRACAAVLTTSGGLTSHAAVIARGLRVPAVVGANHVRIDSKQRALVDAVETSRVLAREGERVSVDAHRGLVYQGDVPAEPRVATPELELLLFEARKLRRCALWCVGAPAQAMSARRAAQLDGALCVLGDDPLPEPEGRDVWLEVPAGRALALLPQLHPGFGLVLRGPVEDALLRRIRAVSRVRPLGVRVQAGLTLPPDVRLDLLVFDREPSSEVGAIRAPRHVRIVGAELPAHDFEPHTSLACTPEHALRLALTLATVGRSNH